MSSYTRKIRKRLGTTISLYDYFLIIQKRKCGLCKENLFGKEINIDHKIPKSLKGSNDLDNLQLTHITCNSLKGNKMTKEELEKMLFVPNIEDEPRYFWSKEEMKDYYKK